MGTLVSTMIKKLLIFQQFLFLNANVNCEKYKRNWLFSQNNGEKGSLNRSLADIKEDECHENTA